MTWDEYQKSVYPHVAVKQHSRIGTTYDGKHVVVVHIIAPLKGRFRRLCDARPIVACVDNVISEIQARHMKFTPEDVCTECWDEVRRPN